MSEKTPVKTSRVFIPQWPMTRKRSGERVRWDLSPAEGYGRLFEIVPYGELEAMPLRKLKEILYDFSDDDFILCVGNPSLMVMTVIVAMEMNDGNATLLMWRPKEGRYDEWKINAAFWKELNA